MIVVTGGAGFIGSNVVRGLNRRGIDDILVVDDLRDGRKFRNLSGAKFCDYLDRDEFLDVLDRGHEGRFEAILHQGACADTTEWDGRYMMDVNFRYSVKLLDYCQSQHVPLIYASSASVYGLNERSDESDEKLEQPLNVYGFSKMLFDRYVKRRLSGSDSQIVGLRYFNVYGPGERYKGKMASVAWQLHGQVAESGEARLFEGSDGYEAGEQRRDFIYVEDIVDINLWFLDHPEVSGIFNAGTGHSASFNELAQAVLDWHGRGSIRYVPFPESLKGRYQSFTEANISALRHAGYKNAFRDINAGIGAYLETIGDDQADETPQ